MVDDPEERLEIQRRSLEELLRAGMDGGTVEYDLDLTESIRRSLREEIGKQVVFDAEQLREGQDTLMACFAQQAIVDLLTGWNSRLPGGHIDIIAECKRDADGHWGIAAVRLVPSPMPRRQSDSGKLPRINILRDPGDR